ncbi:MAG: DNA methyltransferase [Solirubrobacterales bacterium]
MDLDLEDRMRVSALPWRGQFSPMTVERLLQTFAPEGATVIDPFVGSGTALLEASRRGHASIGLDVNPAAVALAQCAALAGLPARERRDRLDAACATLEREGVELPRQSGTVQLAHALALLSQGKTVDVARRKIEALIAGLPAEPVETNVLLRDARATGLPSRCAGFALTSPPYINVFNYHQVGRPLSDAFGWPVLGAARSEIGSNRQNRSNRFRTVVQYSLDMALVVVELSRVLEVGATAVLVLGRESRVRGVPFFNGEIVGRLVEAIGVFGQLSKGQRCFVSRFGESITEDVLVLKENGAADPPNDEELANLARAVGRQALEEAPATDQTEGELAAAIDSAAQISSSTMAIPKLDFR